MNNISRLFNERQLFYLSTTKGGVIEQRVKLGFFLNYQINVLLILLLAAEVELKQQNYIQLPLRITPTASPSILNSWQVKSTFIGSKLSFSACK